MEHFYLITNQLKDEEYKVTNEIRDFIQENGKICTLAEVDSQGFILPNTIPKEIDCAIVLGGDGTLIRAARELLNHSIPLLGINLGTLGYLAEVELQDYKIALKRLFQDEILYEKRMMLHGEVKGNICSSNVAMNDIVITREGLLRVIHFNIYVNDILLNSYRADGVIVSTPTGTTGYNLSAGGPVVEPTATMIVITPICSHALNTSSIVLSAEDTIEIEILQGRYGKNEEAIVSFDGADIKRLQTGDRVVIKKAECVTRLVKLSKESFMKTMRKKMKGN